jgi:hypothetical protein
MCEGTVLENLAKLVDDTLTDMKKCLDKVLDLRGKYNLHIERLKSLKTIAITQTRQPV